MFYHQLGRFVRFLCLMITLVLGAQLLTQVRVFAQTEGRIVGTIRDVSKGVLPGVAVVVKNERTGEERTTTTTDQGYYVVTALKPSVYTVRATLPQFVPAESTHV